MYAAHLDGTAANSSKIYSTSSVGATVTSVMSRPRSATFIPDREPDKSSIVTSSDTVTSTSSDNKLGKYIVLISLHGHNTLVYYVVCIINNFIIYNYTLCIPCIARDGSINPPTMITTSLTVVSTSNTVVAVCSPLASNVTVTSGETSTVSDIYMNGNGQFITLKSLFKQHILYAAYLGETAANSSKINSTSSVGATGTSVMSVTTPSSPTFIPDTAPVITPIVTSSNTSTSPSYVSKLGKYLATHTL